MRVSPAVYLDHMTYQGFERPIFVELFGPLIGLEDEWRAQGASESELSLDAFDFDWVPIARVPVATGLIGGQPAGTLEETDTYRIERDSLGRTKKLFKQVATIALPLDYPVHNFDDWLAIKPMLTFDESRFGADWLAVSQQARADDRLLLTGIPGGFDLPRQLMGEEECCLAFYTQPELLHDILATAADTAYRVLERVTAEVVIDQLSVHEDLAGKSGSLIGPAQIGEVVAPYYRRVWDLLRDRGTRIFAQDSDGNLNSVLESFVTDGGINETHPIEPAAGMDPVDLRERFGTRLGLRGGIDKHVLRQSKAAIRAELEAKLLPLKDSPGTVFSLDHRIPPGTPLDHYRYYVDTAREILGLPPRRPEDGHWQRMAF